MLGSQAARLGGRGARKSCEGEACLDEVREGWWHAMRAALAPSVRPSREEGGDDARRRVERILRAKVLSEEADSESMGDRREQRRWRRWRR